MKQGHVSNTAGGILVKASTVVPQENPQMTQIPQKSAFSVLKIPQNDAK